MSTTLTIRPATAADQDAVAPFATSRDPRYPSIHPPLTPTRRGD